MINFSLPIIFGILGFLITSKPYVKFFDKNHPILNLIVYYLILFFVIMILEKSGLIVGGIPFTDLRHTIGSMLIIFAFFMVIKSESCYINEITDRSCDPKFISPMYISREDGVVYYLFSKITDNIQLRRLYTYILTPILLSIIGLVLIGDNKPKISII